MVLTTAELVSSLQNEVRILLHLATKVDRAKLDYRPTPKQRSTLEWFQYLAIMGPVLIKSAKAGAFDVAAWTAADQSVKAQDFDQTLATIAATQDEYETLLRDFTADDYRVEIEMFGRKSSRGAFIVNTILCAHAAYRTQIFVYLKACGREELSTMNLWAGADAPAA